MGAAEDTLKGKKILLLYARFFGYDQIVKAKLESLGAEVDLYDARANISTFEKALKKVNSSFYYKKQYRFHKKIYKDNANKQYDYIYTNENIASETLKAYKRVFPGATIILYLDDSVENLKGVEKTFYCYDKILTFDSSDAEKYHLQFRPLFFSDLFSEADKGDTKVENEICFIGTCHSDRLNVIDKILNKYKKYHYYLYCYLQSWYMYYYYRVVNPVFRTKKKDFFRYKQKSLAEVAGEMRKSIAILDIQHPLQTGLTMRTIETLGCKKKIITTNKDIMNYDFYNKSNIAIIDRCNPIIDEDFFTTPYVDISEDMYKKYSIEGWIKEIFC